MSKADDELRRAGCFELFEVDAVSDQPASATPKGNGRATSAGAAPEKLAKGSPSSASHPNARNGMPTTIEVRMNVFNVSNVDEKNFVFEAKSSVSSWRFWGAKPPPANNFFHLHRRWHGNCMASVAGVVRTRAPPPTISSSR